MADRGTEGETAAFIARATRSKLVVDLCEPLWPADVDEGQIAQVINADQAMPEGGLITVTVENVTLSGTEESLPAGEHVRCRVTDEGVGIPNERLARIFEPYFTTKKAGNGLGLARSSRSSGATAAMSRSRPSSGSGLGSRSIC